MKFLPYVRLMRLPNVFTALADIAMCVAVSSAFLASRREEFLAGAFFVLAASFCLYLSGMVWNDYFDIEIDRKERPFRPLPSGKVAVDTAKWLAICLMLAGMLSAFLADDLYTTFSRFSHYSLISVPIAFVLCYAIIAYDALLKHWWIGPVAMALCRFLNVMLGFSFVPHLYLHNELRWELAGTVAVYILGVTIFAKQEAENSRRWKLIAGACIMFAAVLHYPFRLLMNDGYWNDATPVALPPIFFPVPLLTLTPLFLLGIGIPVVRAIRQPGSKNVQAAVKRCILGLIVFDAILATMFVGWAGLWIVLLLIPAVVLGKWVYST